MTKHYRQSQLIREKLTRHVYLTETSGNEWSDVVGDR